MKTIFSTSETAAGMQYSSHVLNDFSPDEQKEKSIIRTKSHPNIVNTGSFISILFHVNSFEPLITASVHGNHREDHFLEVGRNRKRNRVYEAQ
jgi:hypothetical protein